MTQPNIDEIKGSLNTFKKITDCVDFAVGIVNELAVYEQRKGEAEAAANKAVALLEAVNSELQGARNSVVVAREKAESEIAEIAGKLEANQAALLKSHAGLVAEKHAELADLDDAILAKKKAVEQADAVIAAKKAEIVALKQAKADFLKSVGQI